MMIRELFGNRAASGGIIHLSKQPHYFNYCGEQHYFPTIIFSDFPNDGTNHDTCVTVFSHYPTAGGLLGLCMGFSLGSLFEIFFHFIRALKVYVISNAAKRRESF